MDEPARGFRFGALAHRNFRLFFLGQGVSLIGTWMQNVAQGWLVLELTNSPVYVGLVSALGSFGVLLLTLYAGVVVGRTNKHRLVILTQTLSMLPAFALAALVWSRAVAVWHVAALAAFLGVVNAFDIPARQSFIVDLVGKDDLMNAIALNSSAFNAARVIGPAVAGALIGVLGVGASARRDRRIRKGPTLIAAGAAFGLLLVAFALSTSYLVSVVLLALTGGAMIVNNALANTMIQEIVPDRLRGRVMGFYSFVFVGLAPLGSLEVGTLAERIGTPAAVALGGAATALAVTVAGGRGGAPRGNQRGRRGHFHPPLLASLTTTPPAPPNPRRSAVTPRA